MMKIKHVISWGSSSSLVYTDRYRIFRFNTAGTMKRVERTSTRERRRGKEKDDLLSKFISLDVPSDSTQEMPDDSFLSPLRSR